MDKPEEKVYCYDCKFFYDVPYEAHKCRYVLRVADTPLEKKKVVIGYDYENYNLKNNCKYYKPSLFKRIKQFLARLW